VRSFRVGPRAVTDMFSVADRVVAITGGSGQLGRRFTAALLERGARVVILDLAPPKDARLGKERGLLYLKADVTRRDSLEAAFEAIADAWGAPHALINNAALDSPPGSPASENGPFEDYPLESWARAMDVNLTGAFLACQVFGGAMAKAGRGSIINVSSIYGVVSPDQRIYEYRRSGGDTFFKPVAYSASKSGLLNLTRYLSTYWAPRGVRVNTLTLGGVFNDQDQRFLEGYCARVPLGRMADEREYEGPVLFLCSDASSYMTGSNLVVDGGWTAW
jgi:NAD(P)-dependent dehydrogenase (short-subunit alcohol dehydrogenase family)